MYRVKPLPIENPDDITVVIPAAGPVPEGVLALGNITCPAMIPVGGRPVIYWIMDYLRSLGLRRFVIGVQHRGLFVEDFVECACPLDCEVEFVVPEPGGLSRTVTTLLEQVQTPSTLVVLGDTYFTFKNPHVLERGEPFALIGEVEASYRWCIARLDDEDTVVQLLDK